MVRIWIPPKQRQRLPDDAVEAIRKGFEEMGLHPTNIEVEDYIHDRMEEVARSLEQPVRLDA